MQIIERLHQILSRTALAAQLRAEDGVDLTRLGEMHHLLSLNAVVERPAGRLFEHSNDVVAGAPGERAQVSFLALARLIVGANAAIDGDLSHLKPLAKVQRLTP
jgi:hypothetical protein